MDIYTSLSSSATLWAGFYLPSTLCEEYIRPRTLVIFLSYLLMWNLSYRNLQWGIFKFANSLGILHLVPNMLLKFHLSELLGIESWICKGKEMKGRWKMNTSNYRIQVIQILGKSISHILLYLLFFNPVPLIMVSWGPCYQFLCIQLPCKQTSPQ